MNMAIPHLQAIAPTSRTLMERALEPYILLGMPHLTPFGLSETWLMKELGHRHWLMLAIRLGMNNVDFRTSDGREAYASICASSLVQINGGLAVARANDILEINSSFSFLLKDQHSSYHRLRIGNRQTLEVELISIFVARRADADNHTLARVEKPISSVRQFARSELADKASAMRKAASLRQNLGAEDNYSALKAVFAPSPNEDFNGAGLLYFANFQRFGARAISDARLDIERFTRHEVFFFGNVQAEERITVCLHRLPTNDKLVADIIREDGKIIAIAKFLST